MSEKFKLKSEVVAILKANIEKGLAAFGVSVTHNPGESGWLVMESDQSSFRFANNAVIFYLEKAERIGWQSNRSLYNSETDQFDVIDYFIEQQIWRIKVLYKSTTETITASNIPVQGADITSMLIAWFNRLGCMEFREHNMANLFIQMKDVRTYKDKSDVSQWTTEFPLKLQVIKQFETEIPYASPKYGGVIPIEGKTGKNGRRDLPKKGLISRLLVRIKGIFG